MKFVLSGNLLRFSSFGREVSIDAPTLSDGLFRLCEQCPSLKPVLLSTATGSSGRSTGCS